MATMATTATRATAQAKPATPPAGKAASNTPAPNGAPAAATATGNAVPAAFVKPNRPLGAITALAFSSDGKKLAVGTYGQAVVYDTSTWQQTGQFKQVFDSVRALAFQPEGALLAVASGVPARSGFVTLWDTSGAQKPYTYPQEYDTVEAVAFRKDGKALLLGANDNKAHYYTSLNGTDGTVIDGHNGRVQAVAFSPKENSIYVTGAMDKIVKVWVQKNGQNVINFDQSDNTITGLAFLNNGDQFVGSSLDGKLYWWGVGYDSKNDTYGGYMFRQFEAHPGGVYCLSAAQNGQRFITSGADKVVCVWNLDNGQKIRAFTDSQQPMYAVALSPDGKTAVAGGREGVIYVWDVEGNKLLTQFVPPALAPAPTVKPASSKTTKKH